MPAPSASTNPSRSRSQGRLAACGSSLRVDSARADAKPPNPSTEVTISAATGDHHIDVAALDHAPASPILWLPVEHAVTMPKLGPLMP